MELNSLDRSQEARSPCVDIIGKNSFADVGWLNSRAGPRLSSKNGRMCRIRRRSPQGVNHREAIKMHACKRGHSFTFRRVPPSHQTQERERCMQRSDPKSDPKPRGRTRWMRSGRGTPDCPTQLLASQRMLEAIARSVFDARGRSMTYHSDNRAINLQKEA